MPEFFLELFSEEIPARMQQAAITELCEAVFDLARGLNPNVPSEYDGWLEGYSGPRRLAVVATIASERPKETVEVRGPKVGAPEAAMEGFLRKHGASRIDLVVEGSHYILRQFIAAESARAFIARKLPELILESLQWPKTMRWGQGKDFAWVRPLRRMICLLDGEVVPVRLGPVVANDETEGHRVLAPEVFKVSSATDWLEKLEAHYVIADRGKRRRSIVESYEALGRQNSLSLDEALVEEVIGLVEWPVLLIGGIDQQFMSLPPEVRELSMKVNQKYFSMRDSSGQPAPSFAFVANQNAPDGGAAIIAGNERVLRARLSDARHFWQLDLKTPLKDLLPKLEKVTFHAKIGNQRERAERIAKLSKEIASQFHNELHGDDLEDAEWAGRLSKADLVTAMVTEFPELQGVIGGYYASESRYSLGVSSAIKSHYQPKGPRDKVPQGIVASSVALADKIDMLAQFFGINEFPTGSSDPYALRRAALGVSRIILENKLSFSLGSVIADERVYDFIVERLRVKLQAEGERHDILSAAFASRQTKNLLHLMRIVSALSRFLSTKEGMNLLQAYRRAANILKVEDAKDGPHEGLPRQDLYVENAEKNLASGLDTLVKQAVSELKHARYGEAMHFLSLVRPFVDDFFLKVTVNAPEPELRLNRLRLLAQLRDTMHQIADFSKIEG